MVVNPALLTSTSTMSPRDSSFSGRAPRASASVRSAATASARTLWTSQSSSARARRRSSRRATSVTPKPRAASCRAISAPIPDDAPVTRHVAFGLGAGSDIDCIVGAGIERPSVSPLAS